jgi:hypothetical protein
MGGCGRLKGCDGRRETVMWPGEAVTVSWRLGTDRRMRDRRSCEQCGFALVVLTGSTR